MKFLIASKYWFLDTYVSNMNFHNCQKIYTWTVFLASLKLLPGYIILASNLARSNEFWASKKGINSQKRKIDCTIFINFCSSIQNMISLM